MAVKHCHDNQIVHRHIRPENVLLNKNGDVKLDFSIEQLFAETIGKPDVREKEKGLGRASSYISPETILGGTNLGKQSDIWGLGVGFFEMFALK